MRCKSSRPFEVGRLSVKSPRCPRRSEGPLLTIRASKLPVRFRPDQVVRCIAAQRPQVARCAVSGWMSWGKIADHIGSKSHKMQCGTGLSRGPSTDRIKSYLKAISKTGSLPNPCCDCAASSSDRARCPTVVREGLYGPAGVGAAGGQRRGLNERYCHDGRNEEAVLMDRCMLCIASITPSMVDMGELRRRV